MEVSVVYDTSIFLQATISRRGPAATALQLFDQGRVTLYVSQSLLDELRDVLNRPSIRRKNPDYTDEDIENLLRRIETRARRIIELPSRFTYSRDPKDEHIINLAVEASVEYLVTRDNDLLDLMVEADKEGQRFRQEFPGIIILDPVAFIQIVSTFPQQN